MSRTKACSKVKHKGGFAPLQKMYTVSHVPLESERHTVADSLRLSRESELPPEWQTIEERG